MEKSARHNKAQKVQISGREIHKYYDILSH